MQWRSEQVNNWEELRPYVDTALLPLYLYRQELSVPQHVNRMTALANAASGIEQRLRGRVLQFPLAYQGEGNNLFALPTGFPVYIILRYAGDEWQLQYERESAVVHTLSVWEEDLTDPLRFEVAVQVLYEAVTDIWRAMRENR
ncbi:MAG: DUF2487 family protein [Brevibacillus sp.]|nr:DUF2487 family protein [Brevibacillus sp.]